KVRPFESQPAGKKAPVFSGTIDQTKILAIGASTGGTKAIQEVLLRFPAAVPPILIVQHIPPLFSKAFATRLNEICAFKVKEAQDGDLVEINQALVAPGGKQMRLEKIKGSEDFCVRITDDPPVNRHRPSVDYLFDSVAREIGAKSIGIILTGM